MADENTTQPVEISEIEAKDIATWIIDAGAEWETQLSNQLSEAYGATKGSAIFDVVKKIKVGALTTGLGWDSSKTIDQNVVNIAGGTIPSLVGTVGATVILGASAPAWLIGTIAVSTGIALDYSLKSIGINTGDIVESTYNYMVEHISASSADGIDFHLEVTAQNYLNNESSLVQTLKDMDNAKNITLNFSDDVTLVYNPITDTVDVSTTNIEKIVRVNKYLQNSVFSNSVIKSDIIDLSTLTTVSGGYGAIVNVKDTSGNDIFIVPDEYGNVSVYDNNGQLDVLQASSILNVLSSDNISDFSDTQQNISYVWNKNLISENFYSTLSRNIRNYLINESPSNDYSFTQNTTDTNTNPTTIFDLASQYNVSVSQLEEQNTWLKDRTSDSLPSVFKNSYYNTINIENNTGISYNYNYNYYTSDSNQSGSINEDEIVQKVSFIKSKQI